MKTPEFAMRTAVADAGLLSGVTLRRQTGGGAWTTVQQVQYAYYDGTQTYGGNLGDLMTATVLGQTNSGQRDCFLIGPDIGQEMGSGTDRRDETAEEKRLRIPFFSDAENRTIPYGTAAQIIRTQK